MKLKSMEIIQALEYSKHRNINGLCSALNNHMGVKEDYDSVRAYVTEGAEGIIAAHIAYEVGLPTPRGYVAVMKPYNPKSITPPVMVIKSKYKGVSWSNGAKMWSVSITILCARTFCGYFPYDKEDEAALAFNAYAEPLGRKLNVVHI